MIDKSMGREAIEGGRIARVHTGFLENHMKFEYKVLPLIRGHQAPDQIEQVLNLLGESEWELITTFQKEDATPCFVLKRPKD